MAVPSPQPRRVATPRWLDTRLVLGVVLVLAAVLVGAIVFSRASRTYATVAATRDLAAGTILRSGDVEIIQAQLPDHGDGVYLAHTDAAVGKKLGRAVSKGELVPSAAVTSIDAQTRVTVPLPSGSAPDLRAGQRIEVWVSTASCPSVVLLPDVTVQEVHADSGGSFSTGSGGQVVVLSVDPAVASRVIAALAIDQAQIRAGVLVGGEASPSPSVSPSASAAPSPSTAPSPSASAGPGGLPDDLAACASATPTR